MRAHFIQARVCLTSVANVTTAVSVYAHSVFGVIIFNAIAYFGKKIQISVVSDAVGKICSRCSF